MNKYRRSHLTVEDDDIPMRSPSPGVIYRQRATRPAPLDDRTRLIIGISLIAGSISFLVCGLYAILVSPFMPTTGYFILDAVKDDEFYKYLLPLLIPAGLVAVIVNWGGLHYFRHA